MSTHVISPRALTRRALAAARRDIRQNSDKSLWVGPRLSADTKDLLTTAGIEIRQKPDVWDGFLAGLAVWRHMPADVWQQGGWRDL